MRRFMALTLFLLLPAFALSHGTGSTLEKQVGDVLVDIGYDAAELSAGTPVRFDFALTSGDTEPEDVPFRSIWVRIVRENTTILATGIHASALGRPTLLYAFPEKGSYELVVRYEGEEKSVAEASFPLSVAPGENGSTDTSILWGLGGLLLGGIGAYLLARRRV